MSARIHALWGLAILLALCLGVTGPAHADAERQKQDPGVATNLRVADRDCADFPSQRAAQIFFLNNNPQADPHRLDADGDLVVCESLPCPCYYGTKPPDSTPSTPPTQPAKPAKIKVVRVLNGELIKVREGAKKPFVVHLMGVDVDKSDRCVWQGAKQDLKSWIKPGRVVRIAPVKASKKRDSGHLLANLVTVQGDYTIGGSQIATGWGEVAKYRFSEKDRYTHWERQAKAQILGAWGDCVPNSGAWNNPARPGMAFEVAGMRYTFGATDPDAWPEMQAEKQAMSAGGPLLTSETPEPGYTFVRVQVTVTNIGSASVEPHFADFNIKRGEAEYDQWGDSFNGGWCGSGDAYIEYDRYLSRGESLTGWVCATVPGPLQPTDLWRVEPEPDQARFVKVG